MNQLARISLPSLILTLIISSALARTEICLQAFRVDSSLTLTTVAYLKQLLQQDIISVESIREMKVSLQKDAQIKNPISPQFINGHYVFKSSQHVIHFDGLEKLLRDPDLKKEMFLKLLDSILIEKTKNADEQENSKNKTLEPWSEFRFHPVDARPFKDYQGRAIKLTHDILVADTLVTEGQWKHLMGELPKGTVQGDPTLPVRNITWWSALELANRKSEKEGLTPSYDFSGIVFSGRAEDGTRKYVSGILKINAITIYGTTGYRLPTAAEALLLIDYFKSSLEQHKQAYHQVAWYISNSQNLVQPVGILLPTIIGKNTFFDLSGNLPMMTSDSGFYRNFTDPQLIYFNSPTHYMAVGASFRDEASEKHHQGITFANEGYDIGIRLFRTRQP